MTERRTFAQGWSAASFKVQFPDMDTDVATRLDRINEAITTLFLEDMITESQMHAIRQKKFPKMVGREVAKMNKKVAKMNSKVVKNRGT